MKNLGNDASEAEKDWNLEPEGLNSNYKPLSK